MVDGINLPHPVMTCPPPLKANRADCTAFMGGRSLIEKPTFAVIQSTRAGRSPPRGNEDGPMDSRSRINPRMVDRRVNRRLHRVPHPCAFLHSSNALWEVLFLLIFYQRFPATGTLARSSRRIAFVLHTERQTPQP